MRIRSRTLFLVLALCATQAGCVTSVGEGANAKPSNLTQGQVELTIKPGITTKADVLQKFGAPNITTRDGEGREVWSYQRHATVSRSQENYFSVLLAGSNASGFEKSSRTMTLIIKFDEKDIVANFDSMYTSF